MKIDDVIAFSAVVRYKSLSEAGRVLGLTQPMLTRRVQSFEESLGVQLLDRSTKPMTPTPLGLRVYERCCGVLDEVHALRELAAGDLPVSNDLRVGMTQGIAEVALPRLLAQLAEQWPQLTPYVSTGWGGALMDRVEQRDMHAAAVFLPVGMILPRNLDGRLLLRTDLLVVARQGDWPRRRYQLSDFSAQGWVLNPDGCRFRAGLQHALAERQQTLKVRLDAFGRDLQLQAVADGLGLGLVPRHILASSPLAAQVDTLRIADFQPSVDLWLVHQREPGPLADAIAWFGQTLETVLAQQV